MEQPFEITEREHGGHPVIAVAGEIDVATAPELRDRLQAQIAAGHATIIVDLLDVTFLDSTALGVLVGVLKRCREADGELQLVVTEARILKIFEITGLTEVFSISSSLDDVPVA